MARILVTGGAGMIGSNLVKRLVRLGHNVNVVDNLWRGKLEYLYDKHGNSVIDIQKDFHKIDLSLTRIYDDLLEGVDYVVHLADMVAGIGYVFSNQGSIFRQNMLINSNTLNSVKKSKLKGFLYIGTACSFPESLQNTFEAKLLKEKDLYPAQPESAYGWSKLMGQYETSLLKKEYGVPAVSLMLHNVYGPPCDFSSERSQVIPSLIRKAINYPKEDFIVWGSGKQRRAFLHVNDTVDAILLALEKGWNEDTIQIGPSINTSIKEIAETIVDISGKDIEIKFDTSKPEGDKSRSADYSRAKAVLGWEPKVDLKDGLSGQFNWVKKQLNK